MKRFAHRLGLFLLTCVLMVGAHRAWMSFDLVRNFPQSSAVGSPAGKELEDARILDAARRTDDLARYCFTIEPPRDPFSRPVPAAAPARTTPPSHASLFAIPRILRIAEEEGRRKVVLTFGRLNSPPLARGESFREWKILGIEEGRVLVENGGITYTLSCRDPGIP